MADHVEEVMQEMLPELDDLRRKKIFNDDEIREIVKRRRAFEYGLRRIPSRPEDYLSYVRYEVAVESLRKRRSKELNWRKKRTVSDGAGLARMINIFYRATRTFKGDKKMWYQFVDFLIRSGSGKVLGKVIMRALKLHPREIHFWLLAADRELKLGHIKAARSLLTRGLRFSPKSSKLWREFLRLEVRVASHIIVVNEMGDKKEEAAGDQAAADHESKSAKPTVSPWAPSLMLLRRSLGRLAEDPAGCAALLQQAKCCVEEARESVKDGHGLEDWDQALRAALDERRPGICKGVAWSEASAETAQTLWQLWWDSEMKHGRSWSEVVEVVTECAPCSVLRHCAGLLVAAAMRASDDRCPDGRSALSALLALCQAPRAVADAEVALAMLESLAKYEEHASGLPSDSKAEVAAASKDLQRRAAKAHPTSCRLALLDSQDPMAIAKVAQDMSAEEAADLWMSMASAFSDGDDEASPPTRKKARRTVAANSRSRDDQRQQRLETVVRALASEASPAPLVSAHLSHALASASSGGLPAFEAACDEVHVVAGKLWDMPTRRVAVLSVLLDAELRICGAFLVSGSVAVMVKRLSGRFEELLSELSDADVEKEDVWIKYMHFVQSVNRSGCSLAGVSLASITDLHWRAMRSVEDQTRFSEKAQRYLQHQAV